MKRRHEEISASSTNNGATIQERQRYYPPWASLNIDLLAECMSYCDAVDLIALRCSSRVFRQAARLTVSRAESLHLSVLHDETNKEGQYQESCVTRLLEDVGASLQTIEFSGLSHVRGGFLESTLQRCGSLTSLSFYSCTNLDPRLLQVAIESSPANLIHLNLQGCDRVDVGVVDAVTDKWHDLESLLLSGCSETIDDDCILRAIRTLRNLRVLDLGGLQQLGRTMADRELHILSLPSSLECLYLGGCDAFQLPVLGQIAQQLEPVLAATRQEGNLGDLCKLVKTGQMDELWAILDPQMNAFTRDLVATNRFPNMDTVLKSGWKDLRLLDLCICGRSGPGFPRGLVGFFGLLSGGSLREVNISGCYNVNDADIQVLAVTCTNSLTCFKAMGSDIGDDSLQALAASCKNLTVLDLSYCDEITDEGIHSLCPRRPQRLILDNGFVSLPEQGGCPKLRALYLRDVPHLTDDSILAIGGLYKHRESGTLHRMNGGLKKLLQLDVRECHGINGWAVQRAMVECVSLVELDARDIGDDNDDDVTESSAPATLRFLNDVHLNCSEHERALISHGCCNIMTGGLRSDPEQGVVPLPMYHCIDCKLLPSDYRGICATCVEVCHKGHQTFFGSMISFYCDCAIGVAGGEDCKALVSNGD